MGSCNSIRSFVTLILLTGLPVIVCAGNHHAVVLEENNVFTVEDINQAEYKRHVRLLIRDKNGLEYTRVSYTDGRYYRCEDVSAFITDTTGEKLKELDTDDIHRSNITPEISDRWEYWFDLTYTSFPFILEYTISYEFHSLFFWPDWSPAWEIPVSESQYILNLEDDIAFSWYNIGIDIHPDTVTTGPARTLVWRMENIEPLKKEDLAVSLKILQEALKVYPGSKVRELPVGEEKARS